MATFADLQTRVNRRVIDLPTAVVAEIPTLINEAIRDAEDAHNFRIMEAEVEYNTLLNTRRLPSTGTSVPADWKEKRSAPWLREGEGGTLGTRPIEWATSKSAIVEVYALDDTVDGGRPAHILEASDTVFEVYPFPDGNSLWTTAPVGEYRVVIPYWKLLPDLVNGTDTNWFTTEMPKYIIDQATAEAFGINWDEAREQIWAGKAAIRLQRGIRVDKRSRLEKNIILTPNVDVHGPRHPRSRRL